MANISFRSFLGILFGIQSWLYAEGQGGMIKKHALIGQQVDLTCYLNSAEDVAWRYSSDGNVFSIYTCQDNQNSQCALTRAGSILSRTTFNFQATRSNDTSVLSLTIRRSDEKEHGFKCESGNYIMQKYLIKTIELNTIIPNCNVTSPRSDENGVCSMTLSCEVNSGELDVNFTLKGIGLNVLDDAPWSFKSIKAKTLYFDDFYNVHNASCNVYFPDIDITRSCTYPNIIKAHYIKEENDIVVECDHHSDVDHWRFYSSDGSEGDIKDRSWIREGGRSLLIRDISEQDVGKVVVCRTKRDDNQTNKGTIGFHVISKIPGDNNKSNSEDPAPTPSVHDPYLMLTLLFLTLWLTTTAVCGVWSGCRSRRSHEVSTIPRAPDDEQTKTTPEYATVILSTNGGNDLDNQGSSSGGLGLAGEESEGERMKSLGKESNAHYMDMSGNHGPTEYETIKSITYENPRGQNDVVPEGSSQVDSGSAGGITMAKGPVSSEVSKAYYIAMSGNHGRTDYEAMKSLTYANV